VRPLTLHGRRSRAGACFGDSMNAFNWTMATELENALAAADQNDTVRAIVLTGRGKGRPSAH